MTLQSNPKLHQYCTSSFGTQYLVFIAPDGDKWGAVLGKNLVDGFAGFGNSVPQALRALADDLERRVS